MSTLHLPRAALKTKEKFYPKIVLKNKGITATCFLRIVIINLWEPQLEYYGLNFLCLQSTNTPRPFFKPKFLRHKPRKFRTNIVSLNFHTRQMEPPLVYGNLCAKNIMSQTTLSVETSCTHTFSTFAWLCVCVCVCVVSLPLLRIFFHAFVSRYVYEIQESSVIRSLYLLTNILGAGFFSAFILRSDIILWAHPFRILSPKGNGLSEVGSRP
jgi:hypothetical protein